MPNSMRSPLAFTLPSLLALILLANHLYSAPTMSHGLLLPQHHALTTCSYGATAKQHITKAFRTHSTSTKPYPIHSFKSRTNSTNSSASVASPTTISTSQHHPHHLLHLPRSIHTPLRLLQLPLSHPTITINLPTLAKRTRKEHRALVRRHRAQ